MKQIATLLAIWLWAVSLVHAQTAADWVSSARQQQSSGQAKTALVTLSQCLQENSTNKICQLERAQLYMDLKEYAKAVADFDTLIAFYTEKLKNAPPPEGFMMAVNDNPDRLQLIAAYEGRGTAKDLLG